MKVIAIVNQKGGCGKTTTSVNLSFALSKKYKTLLIDLDPQSHATLYLGMKNQEKSIVDVFESFFNENNVNLNPFVQKRKENLFVLTSRISLSIWEHKINGLPDKLFFLYKILSLNAHHYDYVIIDCPPNLGLLSLNAIVASSYIIVPILVCPFSLEGLKILNEILELVKEKTTKDIITYYLITQFDRRSKFSLNLLENIRKELKKNLLNTIIRTNISLREASFKGVSIFEHKPFSRGAQDYSLLSEEITRLDQDKSWAYFFFKGKDFKEIYVVGDFNLWQKKEEYKMKRIDKESWFLTIPLKKGKYHYKFLAEDKWLTDPCNPHQEDDNFGGKNSVIFIS